MLERKIRRKTIHFRRIKEMRCEVIGEPTGQKCRRLIGLMRPTYGVVDSYALGTKTKVKTLFTLTVLPLIIDGLKIQLRAASTAALLSAR